MCKKLCKLPISKRPAPPFSLVQGELRPDIVPQIISGKSVGVRAVGGGRGSRLLDPVRTARSGVTEPNLHDRMNVEVTLDEIEQTFDRAAVLSFRSHESCRKLPQLFYNH
jgi:hypothetical protein